MLQSKNSWHILEQGTSVTDRRSCHDRSWHSEVIAYEGGRAAETVEGREAGQIVLNLALENGLVWLLFRSLVLGEETIGHVKRVLAGIVTV